MHGSVEVANQHFSSFLDRSLVEGMDLDAIVKDWARRVLSSAKSLSRNERQSLHDICRPDRLTFTRSALSRLLELAPHAAPSDATWGAELLRGAIVRRLDITLPSVDAAYSAEGLANYRGNMAQERFREAPSRGTCDEVCEAMVEQGLASRIAADVSWASFNRRSIVVASR